MSGTLSSIEQALASQPVPSDQLFQAVMEDRDRLLDAIYWKDQKIQFLLSELEKAKTMIAELENCPERRPAR